MRNGNYLSQAKKLLFPLRSYPTYEEWKPGYTLNPALAISGSYPTYEEWKLIDGLVEAGVIESSYPTYEEWKLKKTKTW